MKLGILVSGGDSPGINAVIYGAYEAAQAAGAQLVGVSGGLKGVLDRRIQTLENLSPELVQAPGSILPTGRFEAFRQEGPQLQVKNALLQNNIDGLVVVGGNGSLAGARALANLGYPVIGVPATVDGDVFATQSAVGFATGVQAAANAIGALQSTAAAYPGRVFLLETLGGTKGYLALVAGLSAAADLLVIPEAPHTGESVVRKVREILDRQGSVVGVVCEGAAPGWKGGDQNYIISLGEEIQRGTGVRARYSVLGYGLRGERPVAEDCLLGRWCGNAAVKALAEGKSGLVAGMMDGRHALLELDPEAGGFPMEYWLSLARQSGVLPE